MWLEQLVEVDRERSGYQDQAVEDLITLDEVRVKLSELEDYRKQSNAG